MIAYILFFLIIATAAIAVFYVRESEGASLMMLVFPTLLIIPIGFTYADLADDLGALSQIDNRIVMAQEELGKLDKKLDGVSLSQTELTLNADSPIASMIAARNQIASKVIGYRDRKYKLLAGIKATCIGPMGGVSIFFSPDPCE